LVHKMKKNHAESQKTRYMVSAAFFESHHRNLENQRSSVDRPFIIRFR
jgi:hypothetical protein